MLAIVLALGGRLFRSVNGDRPRHYPFLQDYSFLIQGLLDLYEATGKVLYLERAVALDPVLSVHYEDKQNGGFFLTSDDHEQLLAREKPNYDGAEPTGNSVEILNLLRLHELTSQDRYRQRAEKAFQAFGDILTSRPAALSEMLLALDFYPRRLDCRRGQPRTRPTACRLAQWQDRSRRDRDSVRARGWRLRSSDDRSGGLRPADHEGTTLRPVRGGR